MGLAPKQRDRLSTINKCIRCFGACPTFRRANRVEYGPRETGTGTVRGVLPRFGSGLSTEPVPVSR